jgi:hypothetical protein
MDERVEFRMNLLLDLLHAPKFRSRVCVCRVCITHTKSVCTLVLLSS